MHFSEVHPFVKEEGFIKKYQGFGRMAQLLRASIILTAGGGLVLSTLEHKYLELQLQVIQSTHLVDRYLWVPAYNV